MSEKYLENKVALVTGGTRGIGKAIAARLLEEGARVAIGGIRQKSVDEALDAFAAGDRVFGMVADVSKLDDLRNFVSAVMQRFEGIHILVNNAGAGIFRSVAEMSPDEWHHMIGLNLTGTYYCCHEVLPILRQGGGGDVINISSLAGRNAFAEAMMLDYRNDGIRVTTIMPGSVDTEFGQKPGMAAKDKNTWKIAPEDIAETVLYALRMPSRTTVSRIEIRPSKPPSKT